MKKTYQKQFDLSFIPFSYTPIQATVVANATKEFIKLNPKFKEQMDEYSWAYHSIANLIPQTLENFWSGHYFPYTDSWHELQISFNLAYMGFYKQSYMSLRSGLELGLLSVYYNINDEGHKTVQNWLKSKDTWEANTPKSEKIWQILYTNENIKFFSQKCGLKEKYDNLGFLHNYVHTKGFKYSNELGKLKSNTQTFEEDFLLKWLSTYEEVIVILITLHLLKYPIGLIKYDWSKKIGIDNPFPVLGDSQIDKLSEILPDEYYKELIDISKRDDETQHLLSYIQNIPDMTQDELEEQITNLDKLSIEHHPNGFKGWEKETIKIYKPAYLSKEQNAMFNKRMNKLEQWSRENNCYEERRHK